MLRLAKWCLAIVLLFGTTASIAQTGNLADTTKKTGRPAIVPKPKRPKPISRELSGGVRINTNGWGLFLNKGYVTTQDRTSDYFYDIRLFQVEIAEIKHPKEIRRSNTNLAGAIDAPPTPFIYGKMNNFYTLKLGYGFRKMIAGKPEPKNTSVHLVYMGGLALGVLKPYYIQYAKADPASQTFIEETITYTDTTKVQFLDKPSIIGRAPFTTGLSELKIVPGVHAKTALHFDFAGDKKHILAAETGFEFQYYAGDVELMAEQDPTSYFISFYASFEFGRRK